LTGDDNEENGRLLVKLRTFRMDGIGPQVVREAPGIGIAATLLSAVETIICYQRQRFRGSSVTGPGRSRYELGLQTKEAAVHSLVEISAAGEALAAMAFETAGLDSSTSVLGLACELFGRRTGSRKMREAVNLLGGSGVIEDGPGFIGHKWAMSQMDAAASGVPEAIQQFRLAKAMMTELFLSEFRKWILELQTIAKSHTSTGAYWLATAMDMWLLTLHHLDSVEFELADVLCCLLASRSQILGVVELQRENEQPELVEFLTDLCHVQVGFAAAEVVRVCAHLVNGDIDATANTQNWLDRFYVLQARLDGCHAESFLAKERAAELLTKVEIPGGLESAR
jgi:hypothetical protein